MIGFPERTEAADYYFTYIDRVTNANIVEALEVQLRETVGFLGAISEEQSLFRYEPGKWSIREVLSHFSDSERTFAFRAFWFARGFETPLPSFDQNIAARGARADYPLAVHIDDFA